MSEAAGNIIDFYSSASGLPLIVLLVMTAIAVGAIIAFIQSRNAANRLIAENKNIMSKWPSVWLPCSF